MRRLRPKAPSPALIISVIALFAALGGGSYALASSSTPLQTFSNYTQNSPNQTITSSGANIGPSVKIRTRGTKRLIASAAVHGVNGVPGAGAYLVCRVRIDGSSGVNDTDYASPAGGFTIVDASVSPQASRVVIGGTHTVTLNCFSIGGGGSVRVVDSSLAAWAVSPSH